ncbi:PREDICTED: uncharacterized protein LOC108563574 [Nicrophorus vespilloides]|uniref:Uncharacterized protein LOC108563574 n=1 Tax=Nicrophorus vespilloides TaxID=110193 RepID=A0ABM1MT79_NICVS|nr:PREDICTED: uncharacterized protein LOC108563574 [Nicrophorus vespilloides]
MEEDEPMYEAEDFMCDQVIISTEVDVDFKTYRSTITIPATKIRLAVALLTDSLLPTVVGAYYAYLRNQKSVLENVRRQILPAVWAVVANYLSRSLSSVQRGIIYPLTFVPIKSSGLEIECETDEEPPEKCVNCIVLSEPDGDIQADVIFIHGLHGSLGNTWKQGLWRHPKHKLSQNKAMGHSQSTGDLPEATTSTHKSLKRSVSGNPLVPPNKIAKRTIDDCIDNDFVVLKNEDVPVKQEYTPCWPQEWLPKDCPGIRVIALNYTTDTHLWRPVWIKKRKRTNMTERSKEMIEHLLNLGVGQNPIVWVGHSKGGLFVKQLIADSWDMKGQSGIGDLYQQTKGILFYSVPHRGSILADFNLPFLRKSIELTEIQRNCPFVLGLHERFLKVCKDETFNPEIFSFIETSFTLMTFIYLKIVAYESADPGIGSIRGVPLDHREICKPAGRDCFLYGQLVKLINSVLSDEMDYDKYSAMLTTLADLR